LFSRPSIKEVAMLVEIYPRFHARFSSLSLLGPVVDDFVVWLHGQGYGRRPIRLRVRATPRIDARLRRRGVRRVEDLSRARLPASRVDIRRTCTSRPAYAH
jgi:hypothetical protein